MCITHALRMSPSYSRVWFVTIAINEQEEDEVDRVADDVSAVYIETNQPEASASVATDNYPHSNDHDRHGDEEQEEDDDEADDSGL